MSDSRTRTEAPPDALLARWRRDGRPADLAALFDAVGPELFRVALHLCPDAASAEDALQDTFVVVLERAHLWDPERPAMPWLVGILKNQALMARRRAGRSPDPDRAPVPSTPLDPAFEAAESEERERLREVLKNLPEPYRGVALLRWRYGLDPAAIAEVQGVPPGTVRSWLSRALSRIKVSMVALPAFLLVLRPERGVDGVRAAILRRAATRHLPRPEEVVASGGVVVKALAGVPVGRALLLGSIAVFAVGTAGWWLFGGGDGAGEQGVAPAPAQVASAPPAPKAPVAEPAAATPAAVAAAASPEPAEEPFDGVEVEVFVRDAEGRPVAGAHVQAVRPGNWNPRDPEKYLDEPVYPGDVAAAPARTDAEGRALLRIGRGDFRSFPSSPEVFPPSLLHAWREREAVLVPLAPLPDRGRVRRDAVLEPAGSMAGVVRWNTGGVVPGALAYLDVGGADHFVVRTDEAGRFRFPLVPRSCIESNNFAVRAPDALEHLVQVKRSALDAPDRIVTLSPVWSLRGRCVDGGDAPLEGLTVVALVVRPLTQRVQRTTTTAADGTFLLEGLDGQFASLTVDGGPRGMYVASPVLPVALVEGDLGDLVFGKARELRGVVVRDDGSPVAGALVMLVPGTMGPENILAHAVTDGDGVFSFTVVDNRGARVRRQGMEAFGLHFVPGLGEAGARQLAPDKAGRENAAMIQLARTRGYSRGRVLPWDGVARFVYGALRIRFRFLDGDTDRPALLQEARLKFLPKGSADGPPIILTRKSPEEMTYQWDLQGPGTYQIEVEVAGHTAEFPASVEVTAERETVVDVRVRKKP